MKSSAIKISTIIPVYNVEEYVGQCLDSVLSQSMDEIEVICVDDCSTDNSYRIIREYSEKDDRIKVLRNERNMFAGLARNRGIEAAKGEYIHFLDADDYLTDDVYKMMYDRITFADVDILRVKAVGVETDSGRIVHPHLYSFDMLDDCDINSVTNFNLNPELFSKICVTPWAGLFRRTFLTENDIRFPPLYCVNDRAFFAAAIISARKVCFLDEYVVFHRIQRSTSLVGQRHKHFECHFKSYEAIERLCESLPLTQKRSVLVRELSDIFAWYSEFSKNVCYGRGIYEITKSFLERLDMSFFDMDSFFKIWYYPLFKSFLYDWKLIKRKKWIFFGAGITGEIKLAELRNLGGDVEFFLDNDIRKHKMQIGGLSVYAPEHLMRINIDDYFIVISSVFHNEIAQQLGQMGYVEGKHYSSDINWGAIMPERRQEGY